MTGQSLADWTAPIRVFDQAIYGLPVAISAAIGMAFGLTVGSYLATIYIRWIAADPRKAGAARSHCDSCHRKLRWWELVPAISFFVLRGRCTRCRAPIALSSVAIELLCGLLGAICFVRGSATLAPFLCLMVVLTAFDARKLWLPDGLVAAAALAAVAAKAPDPELGLALRCIGGATGFASLWLVAAAYRRLRGRVGLGGGDPKLFGAIGLWCGPAMLPVILLTACVVGLGDATVRLTRGADGATLALPLGTYLTISTLIISLAKLIGL